MRIYTAMTNPASSNRQRREDQKTLVNKLLEEENEAKKALQTATNPLQAQNRVDAATAATTAAMRVFIGLLCEV